jgi:hypothetical protein
MIIFNFNIRYEYMIPDLLFKIYIDNVIIINILANINYIKFIVVKFIVDVKIRFLFL